MEHSILLTIPGGEVKSSQEGLVEGYGIVFGSPQNPDASKARDFFTAESRISRFGTLSLPIVYHHGVFSREEIGGGTLTKSDDGWTFKGEIDLSTSLGKIAHEAALSKPHGFSTGAVPGTVIREPRENNTHWIKQWHPGEISLTATPAEPRAVITAIKCGDFDNAVALPDVSKLTENLQVLIQLLNGISPTIKSLEGLENFKAELLAKFDELTIKPSDSLQTLLEEKTQELAGAREELEDIKAKFQTSEDTLNRVTDSLNILAGAQENINKYNS